MTNKTKATKKSLDDDKQISDTSGRDAKRKKLVSEIYLSSENNAAAMVMAYNPGSTLDLEATAAVLREQCNLLREQDMNRAEDMLMNQAYALQAMFYDLARSAKRQSNLSQIQALSMLALKAQSQCRSTLQTLSDVKYPKQATFIKQANIAGQQQVNNGALCNEGLGSREEKTIQSNELLKDTSHETEIIGVVTGTTRKASGTDPKLEAVGVLNGAKHR